MLVDRTRWLGRKEALLVGPRGEDKRLIQIDAKQLECLEKECFQDLDDVERELIHIGLDPFPHFPVQTFIQRLLDLASSNTQRGVGPIAPFDQKGIQPAADGQTCDGVPDHIRTQCGPLIRPIDGEPCDGVPDHIRTLCGMRDDQTEIPPGDRKTVEEWTTSCLTELADAFEPTRCYQECPRDCCDCLPDDILRHQRLTQDADTQTQDDVWPPLPRAVETRIAEKKQTEAAVGVWVAVWRGKEIRCGPISEEGDRDSAWLKRYFSNMIRSHGAEIDPDQVILHRALRMVQFSELTPRQPSTTPCEESGPCAQLILCTDDQGMIRVSRIEQSHPGANSLVEATLLAEIGSDRKHSDTHTIVQRHPTNGATGCLCQDGCRVCTAVRSEPRFSPLQGAFVYITHRPPK